MHGPSVHIRLLGRPRIERAGEPVAPRGRKTWALLAYLLLSERPPPRTRVAGILFSEAEDPLGALRWTVADLRRILGGADALRGDPLELRLPEAVAVDVTGGAPPDGELLEGMTFPTSPVFDAWLQVMRRSLAGAARALVHDEALARLAAGDVPRATELAEDLVARDPVDSQAQELLIRCLARGGRQADAERQLASAEALLRRALGITPGPELRLAAREPSALPGAAAGDAEAALAQLEAGEAALEAGAPEPGIDILRQACAEAAAAGDAALEARATELAEGNDELCAVLGVRGMALSDRAHYAAALELLHKSVARAERAGRRRQMAWSLGLIGRIYVLRDELELAAGVLDEALALVAAERWTAFRPWPEALRAEVALRLGDPDAGGVDRTFRLARRLGDPCWEAMTARAAGLIALHEGDAAAAHERFADALARATRVSDTYAWVHAYVLDAAAGLAVRTGAPEADDLVERLAALAGRSGLRELVVRAHVHGGDVETARVLAEDIDNPALTRLLTRAPV